MSLNSLRAGKIELIKGKNTEPFSAYSIDDKNLNSISTIEKPRITKSKTVSFKGIEIIEVESYKKYNEIKYLSLESLESNCMKSYEECKCGIF